MKTEEDTIHLTMLNKLINRLDESTTSLAANVVKLRSFQQYQINAADLAVRETIYYGLLIFL